MKATPLQLGYLVFELNKLKNDYLWIGDLFRETPKNNEKYPNEKANYQLMILADRLSNLTDKQADYCIKCYKGERGYHRMTARNIIIEGVDK